MLASLRAAWDLVVPLTCAGCGNPGDTWCHGCQAASRTWGRGRAHAPDPAPPGFPPLWSAAGYDGVLRTAITAWKDEGRRDLTPHWAAMLREVLGVALAVDPSLRRAVSRGELRIVAAPSSRAALRRRGDAPLRDLAQAVCTGALARSGVRIVDATVRRRVGDQARLDAAARWSNLSGAMVLSPEAADAVDGARVLLIDDVVTTGATLAELARAVREAGAAQVWAVTLAATQRRSPAASRSAADTPQLSPVAPGPAGLV